jgi:peptidase S41-like protein
MSLYKISFAFLLLAFSKFAAFSQNNNYDPDHKYAVNELQDDFQFLRTTLEKNHPNLYLYTSKNELDLFFDSLYKSIINPSSETAFYNLIALLSSKIKDGHTMFLPGEQAINYFNASSKFFPFYIIVVDNKMYVKNNCSSDTSIKVGAEIMGINGTSAHEILNILLLRQIRDGNNQTYPVWILTNYFKEYFGFSFGHPQTFLITYRTENTVQKTKIIYALSKDSIKFYRQNKYSNKVTLENNKQGIFLEINKHQNTGILTIKSFDNEILKSQYNQDFNAEIKKIFLQIQTNRLSNLVLDIRNNQGGDFEPGQILLSYLLRKPIKYLACSKESKIINPVKNNYKGNLYVLINGGSFSSTGVVSSYLDFYKRGTFIGEETGGNKTIISGDPESIILPNTKIACQVSTVKYVIKNDDNDGHGVVPAYQVSYASDDIMSGNDTQKIFAIRLIKENLRRKNAK